MAGPLLFLQATGFWCEAQREAIRQALSKPLGCGKAALANNNNTNNTKIILIPYFARPSSASARDCVSPEYVSDRAGPGGKKIIYLEGWKSVQLANETFGFDGWSTEVRNYVIVL